MEEGRDWREGRGEVAWEMGVRRVVLYFRVRVRVVVVIVVVDGVIIYVCACITSLGTRWSSGGFRSPCRSS